MFKVQKLVSNQKLIPQEICGIEIQNNECTFKVKWKGIDKKVWVKID